MASHVQRFIAAYPEVEENDDVVMVAYGSSPPEKELGIIVWADEHLDGAVARIKALLPNFFEDLPVYLKTSGPVTIE